MSTSPREQQLLNRIASLTRRQEFLEGAVKIIAAIFIGLALGKLDIPWWGIAGIMALMYFFPVLRWLGWPLALWCIYDGGSVEVKVIYCAMLVVTAFSHPVLKQLEKDIHTLINQVSDSTWAEIHAEQNPVQQTGPSPLVQQAISASKIIWRYVAYSFQSDAIPNGEIAFRYAIYSYAVSDLLRQKGIELVVRTHFSTSYAQADDKSTDDPLVANLQNVVNKTTEILGLAHPDPETQSGAYVILSSKEKVLHSNEADTFAVTDADCVSFQRDVRHIRHEIDQLLAEPKPTPQPQTQPPKEEKKSGEGWKIAFITVLVLSLVAAFIIFMEKNFPFSYQATKPGLVEAIKEYKQAQTSSEEQIKITTLKAPEEGKKCPVTVLVDGKETKFRYFVFTAPDSLTPVAAYLTEDEPDLKAVLPLGEYDLYIASGPKWYGVKNITGPEGEYIKCPEVFSLWEPLKETATLIFPNGSDVIPITAENFPQVTIGSSSTIVNTQTTK